MEASDNLDPPSTPDINAGLLLSYETRITLRENAVYNMNIPIFQFSSRLEHLETDLEAIFAAAIEKAMTRFDSRLAHVEDSVLMRGQNNTGTNRVTPYPMPPS